jgi:heptosyltransferase-2
VKILVVKVAAIGDFLMATPALRALKRGGANEVHLLAGRSIAAVAGSNPDVDRVFYLDDRRLYRGSLLAKAVETLRVSWRLRRERYDIGFNFHRDRRFAIILLLAGCRRRIGFRRGPPVPRDRDVGAKKTPPAVTAGRCGPPVPRDRDVGAQQAPPAIAAGRYGRGSWPLTDAVAVAGVKHHIFHYCDLARALGVFCLDFRMEFPLDGAVESAAAEKFLVPAGLDDYVVLAPGGAANVKEEMESRRWPVENFAVLAGLLLAAGRRVVLVGSGADAGLAARITAEQPAVVDLSDRTTLAEAAAVLKRSRWVVCNDSGLMHLAAAVGARVVALFGPTHPGEKKPLAEGSVAVWKGEGMACAPCYHDGIFPRCSHVSCLKKITPREIFELIIQ